MRFRAEVEVGGNCVLEKLNEQITPKEQGHCADYTFRRGFAFKTSSPEVKALRDYLEKYCGQHESSAEGYEVFEEPLSKSMGTRPDEHKSAHKIRPGGEQTKEKKPDKSSVIEVHSVVN
jgi:hypothetical protein